jgi:hypothetical protein
MQDAKPPFEPSTTQFDAAPPTRAGDIAPPEGWPMVIGVLSIIFGSLGALQGVCGAAGLLLVTVLSGVLPPEVRDQMQAQGQMSVPYPLLQGLQLVPEFGVSIVLLVGGILLVRRKRKSGVVLTAFALLDLCSNTYAAVLGYFVFVATTEAAAANPQMQQAGAQWIMGLMQRVTLPMVGITWVVSAIWPVFLIIWFRRAKTRASMGAWG